MSNFIVNIGNFIDENILCKVRSNDFRIISFEVLLMFFTFDFEGIFISCVLVIAFNHGYFPGSSVFEKNLRKKLFNFSSKDVRTISCESVPIFLLLI